MSTSKFSIHNQLAVDVDRAGFIDALKRSIKKLHRDTSDGKHTLAQLMTVAAHRVGYDQWSLFIQDIPRMTEKRFEQVQEIFDQIGVLPRLPPPEVDMFDDYWFDASGD